MAHREKRISEDDDDGRLYECARKYEIIVKQFDELIGLMNNVTSVPKRRRNRKGSSSSGTKSGPSSEPNNTNKAIVETVTRFLQELSDSPTNSEGSRST